MLRALGDASEHRLGVHLNTDHAGRADRYLVRADPQGRSSGALHRCSDFVAIVSCRSVRVTAVGDYSPQLTKVATLARKHHRGSLDPGSREPRSAGCVRLVADDQP
ncbi:unannotated protein [freshwater metagenome]|uniref:Unannotated protein n=1 Tax=freshwater metagenome TaxID=449393 RepID=A0A6J5ZBX1_9ZZZZ